MSNLPLYLDRPEEEEEIPGDRFLAVESVERKEQVSPNGRKYIDIGLGVKSKSRGNGKAGQRREATLAEQEEEAQIAEAEEIDVEDAARANQNRFEGEFKWDGFSETQELVQKNSGLLAQLDEKNRELEQMGVLLEALDPIPGLDPNKYLDILQGTEVVDKDIRDLKILSLAKKSRNLNVALQKERSKSSKLEQEVAILKSEASAQKVHVTADEEPGSKIKLRKKVEQADGKEGEDDVKSKIVDAALNSKLHELRLQCDKLTAELKKTQRALQREVGEDIPLDKLLEEEGGWKGRAQQIVMLRAKLKQYEILLDKSKPTGVDNKAQEDINSLAMKRREEVEQLIQQNQGLTMELDDNKKKYEKAKARTKVLEKEVAKTKEHIRTLLDKTDTDNHFIDALRAELDSVRNSLRTAQSQLEESASSLASADGAEGLMSPEEQQRTKTLLRDQSRQITSQEEIIRQLRQEVRKLEEQLKAANSRPASSDSQQSRGSRRPNSSELRREAQQDLEAQTAITNGKLMEIENHRLSELCELYKAKHLEAEEKVEAGLRAINALKSQMLDYERTRATDGKPQRASGSEDGVKAMLESIKAENSKLRSAYQSTLAAKEKEISILRDMLEQEKRTFVEAIQHLQRVIRGKIGLEETQTGIGSEREMQLAQDNEFLRREVEAVRTKYETLMARSRR